MRSATTPTDASQRDAAFLFFFTDLLRDDPTLTIVDVGAQNLTGESHIYSSLIYKPNRTLRAEFHGPKDLHDIVKTVPMQTRALDALGLEQADFIKLDAQGAEPLILKGGECYVTKTPLVYCETFFVPFYENVPLFEAQLSWFRAHGFELFDLYLHGRRRAELRTADAYPALAPQGGGRLVWADALYGQRALTSGEAGARPARQSAEGGAPAPLRLPAPRRRCADPGALGGRRPRPRLRGNDQAPLTA